LLEEVSPCAALPLLLVFGLVLLELGMVMAEVEVVVEAEVADE